MKDARRGKPMRPVTMESVRIIRKGKDARHFEAPEVFTEEIDKRAEELAEAEALKRNFAAIWLKISKKEKTLLKESTVMNIPLFLSSSAQFFLNTTSIF